MGSVMGVVCALLFIECIETFASQEAAAAALRECEVICTDSILIQNPHSEESE